VNEAPMSQSYERGPLDEREMLADPIAQFQVWMADAVSAGLLRPDAMTLATAGRDGRPSARMVLLRGCDERGFVFFTNYRSRKAKELTDNPAAALVFYWAELERQVRVEGAITRTSAEESDAYFATRPLESRYSAVISPQSEVVESRDFLVRKVDELRAKVQGGPVPRPEFWGGFRLNPQVIEFWQGQPGRLHDRIRYRRGRPWTIERLGP
jgi:pyridoxamine 5'-phosphate oxidase